ncbi:hypothetical protein J0895_10205 [Phormidium pseudopriestleyi FRX01]|uniref:Uncharacterized protein n=1 Tax=Phormidium pseudopriestleyi FRX01 TaxID=1759528 RepID=A0ABS3FQS5_9CYAN|nr:hypothetical protein [Phormidium pseudopriestleyi]MBO0349473.1 hypothetical protein [Phormidium pseudopriestleyi FRX01]
MKLDPIIESGMNFGPYPEGHCFYIEKSKTYQAIQADVKMAEFLLLPDLNKASVWIVEAKSSSPRPETQPNFDEFIQEICDKLTNAMALCIATCLKRHASTYDELPVTFQSLALEKTEFRLILVIKGHRNDWLPPLQDALKKALKPTVQTWKLSPTSVVVLNDTIARSQGLIR